MTATNKPPAARRTAARKPAAGKKPAASRTTIRPPQLPHPVPPRSETLGTPPPELAAAAAAEQPGPLNGAGWAPVLLSAKPAEDAGPGPRITVFCIDDTEYTIAAVPSMSDALEFLHFAGLTAGATPEQMKALDGAAIDLLMTLSFGDDGWRALRQCKTVTAEDFSKIVEIATTVMLGKLELPKG